MLMIIDTETTGKTAGKHEVISLSALAITDDWNQLSYFTSLVKPRRLALVTDEAMKVNQLKLADLSSAPTSEQVRSSFLEWREDFPTMDKVLLVGWNPSFDIPFLKMFFGEVEYDALFKYWSVDVKSLYYLEQLRGKLDKSVNLSLVDVAEHFDIPHKAHDAQGDVYVTYKLLKRLG